MFQGESIHQFGRLSDLIWILITITLANDIDKYCDTAPTSKWPMCEISQSMLDKCSIYIIQSPIDRPDLNGGKFIDWYLNWSI